MIKHTHFQKHLRSSANTWYSIYVNIQNKIKQVQQSLFLQMQKSVINFFFPLY